MEEGLIHWLKPYMQEVGPVMRFTESWFRKHLRGMKKETNSASDQGLFRLAEVKPKRNALRHSYASYWLARGGKEGVGRLALNMGNSESVAKRHYIEVLTPGDGDAWFSIRRD
jgi:hypothetical protein